MKTYVLTVFRCHHLPSSMVLPFLLGLCRLCSLPGCCNCLWLGSECREGGRREGSEQFLSTPRVTKSSQFAWNFLVLAESPILGKPSVPGTLVHPATPPTPLCWGTIFSECLHPSMTTALVRGTHLHASLYRVYLGSSHCISLPHLFDLQLESRCHTPLCSFPKPCPYSHLPSIITMNEATLMTLFRNHIPSPFHPLSEACLTLDMPPTFCLATLVCMYLFVGRGCAWYSFVVLPTLSAELDTMCPVAGWWVGFCTAALTPALLFILQIWLSLDVFFQIPNVAPNKDMN